MPRRLIWMPKPFDMNMGQGGPNPVWKMGLLEPLDATQEATMLGASYGGQVWGETDARDLKALSEPMTGDGPTTPPAPAPSPPPAPAEPPPPPPAPSASPA